MRDRRSDPRDERVLVLAPTGRDARVMAAILGDAGLNVEVCADLPALCEAMLEGAGAAVLAEEALTAATIGELSRTLHRQPIWSDLPLLVSTGQGETTRARVRTIEMLEPTANVTLLERPVRVLTLVTTLEAALRARRRQYTMRALLEEQESRMRELRDERALRERFVSILAHDLRGPLSVAKLGAQRLVEHPERLDERRDAAIRINRNLDRADRMIQDLLDANRIQAGQKLPLRIEECDLVGVARDVVEELGDSGAVRIVLRAPDHLIGHWSAPEVRRALWNLVSNALKYGRRDAPIEVELRREESRVELSVHNEGEPLSAEERATIFEPFARTAAATSSGQGGWGLGLTLVRGCAEAHGGRITVASDPTGTIFTLELPPDSR